MASFYGKVQLQCAEVCQSASLSHLQAWFHMGQKCWMSSDGKSTYQWCFTVKLELGKKSR